MRHGSLFSGIGGFDLAAQWMGWENIFHCEWKEFNQKVLKYYWPHAISYSDIRRTDFSIHRGNIHILTGGFPCQPFSVAGKQEGTEDERHLWPEMLRAIQEIQPTWIVGENVRGIVNWNKGMVFEQVHADLEAEGYEVQTFLLPAASVNAPHERYRTWFIANSNKFNGDISGLRASEIPQQQEARILKDSITCNASNANRIKRSEGGSNKNRSKDAERFTGAFNSLDHRRAWEIFPTQPPVCNGNDGLSARLDGITFPKLRSESIAAGGNAVLPQLVLQIFKAIQEYEKLNNKN
jgi:DNA (cytosine-5)-methyltransferase 1